MTIEELNELVEAAYLEANAFESDLMAVYERSFARAAHAAIRTFKEDAVTAAGFVAPPIDTLTEGMTESEIAQANLIRDHAAQAIALALATVGLGAIAYSFMETISKRGQTNFDQELLRILSQTVQKGIAEGLSADETAVAIQEAFTGVSANTAQMLAQTELTTIVNERSLQAAIKSRGDASEPTYKVWQTMKDARVRVAHASAQSQTVPISQPFNVGGYSMMYPGDPSAPMRLVARCRCVMSYSASLNASGGTGAPAENDYIPFAGVSAEEVTVSKMSEGTIKIRSGEYEAADATLLGDFISDVALTAATITIEVADGEASEEAAAEALVGPWVALLAIENQATEDGRIIDAGALSWRELPLSLMAMDETGPGGHEGAQVAGRIDSIYRSEENEMEVWGAGGWSEEPFGQHIGRLVGEQTLRGNSVDLAVLAYEYRNADTGAVLTDDELMDAIFGENDIPILFAVTEGVILASTVCPTPAIAGAEIMLASGVMRMTFSFGREAPKDVLTAAGAGMAPLHPPAEWFANPRLDGPTPLTVSPEGRVTAHAALWDSCHIGEPSGPGVCVPPPRSGMNYEIFHHGVVTCDNGEDVPVGQITMSTLHAGTNLSWKATQQHYENSGIAVADVVAGEDEYGIWVSGALRPDLPAERVREMKAGAISGDWRSVIDRGLEFIAALIVNIPGFPIPRPEARIVASAAGEEEVLTVIAAGLVTPEDVEGMTHREYRRKIAALTS